MKPILPIVAALAIAASTSCVSDDNWDAYEEWRNTNNAWYLRMVDTLDAQGNKYYSQLSPVWNPGSGVLVHYFNDRKETEGNLSPLITSTIDVKYKGMYYNGAAFDSSYTLMAAYGDSIYRTRLSDVIVGWQIALSSMHVGDSVDIVVPYPVAYGENGYSSIPPFSTLRFLIKLVDIPAYEIENPPEN